MAKKTKAERLAEEKAKGAAARGEAQAGSPAVQAEPKSSKTKGETMAKKKGSKKAKKKGSKKGKAAPKKKAKKAVSTGDDKRLFCVFSVTREEQGVIDAAAEKAGQSRASFARALVMKGC